MQTIRNVLLEKKPHENVIFLTRELVQYSSMGIMHIKREVATYYRGTVGEVMTDVMFCDIVVRDTYYNEAFDATIIVIDMNNLYEEE